MRERERETAVLSQEWRKSPSFTARPLIMEQFPANFAPCQFIRAAWAWFDLGWLASPMSTQVRCGRCACARTETHLYMGSTARVPKADSTAVVWSFPLGSHHFNLCWW